MTKSLENPVLTSLTICFCTWWATSVCHSYRAHPVCVSRLHWSLQCCRHAHTARARAPHPPRAPRSKTDFAPFNHCNLHCNLHFNQHCPHQTVSNRQPLPRLHLNPECVRRNHCNLWCRRDAHTVRARGRRCPTPSTPKTVYV